MHLLKYRSYVIALIGAFTLVAFGCTPSDPGTPSTTTTTTTTTSIPIDTPWTFTLKVGMPDYLVTKYGGVIGARAKVDAAPEVVHRWRRKVRRLRMQLEAAQALGVLHRHDAGRSELARKGKALHKISDRLGWEQDLRMLRNLVRSLPYAEGKQAVMTVVDRVLHAQNYDSVSH